MDIIKSDVLVIGGGTAASVAAASAAQNGKQVTMVFPNGGMSEISSGAVDILGVVPKDSPVICDTYKEGIKKLLEQYPDHVYGKCEEEVQKGVDTLIALAKTGGYHFCGFEGKNVWVPNMLGTFSINAYVPEMMKDAVVAVGEESKILVIGIKGNVSFNARAAAMSYQQYQKKIGGKANYFSTEIQLTGWGDRRKISDGELADYLDTEAGTKELIEAIKTFCSNNRYYFDCILFPPVLGYVKYEEVLKKIKESCRCKAAEIQVFGNSVVGYRFTRAVYRGLEQAGVTLIRGAKAEKIISYDKGVEVECVLGLTDQLHPGEKVTIDTKSVVLATGGFVGGGIKARKTEVWIELLNEKLGKITTDQLDRDAVHKAGQEFMRMGVEVNDDLSVKNEAYSRCVYVCGDVLAGHNFANERSGTGIAVATGYLAGKNAANM